MSTSRGLFLCMALIWAGEAGAGTADKPVARNPLAPRNPLVAGTEANGPPSTNSQVKENTRGAASGSYLTLFIEPYQGAFYMLIPQGWKTRGRHDTQRSALEPGGPGGE